MLWISQENNLVETFGFYLENSFANDFFVNEQAMIKSFIHYFKRKLEKEIHSMDLNCANIKNERKGAFLQQPLMGSVACLEQRLAFYEKIGCLDPLLRGVQLSNREREIIHWLMKGRSSTEIGQELSISHRTVETYITNLKAKLNCQKKSELIDRITLLAQAYGQNLFK